MITSPPRTAYRPPSLLLVLPSVDERAPIRTALAVARGHRGRLRAVSLTRPGEQLPPELRIALYGLGVRSAADQAIEHLVTSARRGAHVPVTPLPADAGERSALVAAMTSGPCTLMVGWSRGGPLPPLDRLRPVLEGFAGPVVLLVDAGPDLATEVLGLIPPAGAPGEAAVRVLLADLENTLPVFAVPEATARAASADATVRTLVVAALEPRSDLESAVPGRLAFVVPAGSGRVDRVLGLIDRVSLARRSRAACAEGTQPPPPAR